MLLIVFSQIAHVHLNQIGRTSTSNLGVELVKVGGKIDIPGVNRNAGMLLLERLNRIAGQLVARSISPECQLQSLGVCRRRRGTTSRQFQKGQTTKTAQ